MGVYQRMLYNARDAVVFGIGEGSNEDRYSLRIRTRRGGRHLSYGVSVRGSLGDYNARFEYRCVRPESGWTWDPSLR